MQKMNLGFSALVAEINEGNDSIPEIIQFMYYDAQHMAVVAVFFTGIQYGFRADTFADADIHSEQLSLLDHQWESVKPAIEEIYLNTMREQAAVRRKMH